MKELKFSIVVLMTLMCSAHILLMPAYRGENANTVLLLSRIT